METKENTSAGAASIARNILTLARNTLLVRMRFMSSALCEFLWEANSELPLATDMRTLWYSPKYILSRYVSNKDLPTRDFLHVVLHGIFRHPFVGSTVNRPLWDLACDIAVESAISELPIGTVAEVRTSNQEAQLSSLRKSLDGKAITAERLYRLFVNEQWSEERAAQVRQAYVADDHAPWYPENRSDGSAALGAAAGSGKRSSNSDSSGSSGSMDSSSDRSVAFAAHRWQELSERVLADLDSFSREFGTEAGDFTQQLREVNRERYDYTAFLRRFAILGEAMRVNDDEFDYVYYTYGLRLYGKMPLIEPLEYKEVKQVREFVIAIDTSGSVVGELVQAFLQKTYNILLTTESFFSKVNIHIVQCDAQIQSDTKITRREELAEYFNALTLQGFGGTDFRPVFEYVNKLISAREFTNLKGLIYFTDGYGVFPERKPQYETAFVFVSEDATHVPDVPPWAIKLILTADDIAGD